MWVIADVEFDTDETAREAYRLAEEGRLAGVSVDLGNVTKAISEAMNREMAESVSSGGGGSIGVETMAVSSSAVSSWARMS